MLNIMGDQENAIQDHDGTPFFNHLDGGNLQNLKIPSAEGNVGLEDFLPTESVKSTLGQVFWKTAWHSC